MHEPRLNSQEKKAENNIKCIFNKLRYLSYKLCITLVFKIGNDVLTLEKIVLTYLRMKYPDDYILFYSHTFTHIQSMIKSKTKKGGLFLSPEDRGKTKRYFSSSEQYVSFEYCVLSQSLGRVTSLETNSSETLSILDILIVQTQSTD